jgi:RNA polymerase sigma-70 factor (ECF subfamily)
VRLFGESRPWSQRLGVRSVRYAEVNGQPGALYLDTDGRPVAVVSLDIADDLVQTVHTIVNPDKLRHLILPTDPD